jgi:predicted component of type VI protein secretion system
MRLFATITCVVLAGCSASDVTQTANALDVENIVKACMTDEILREANASEVEIKQFKKDQAEAGAVTCG